MNGQTTASYTTASPTTVWVHQSSEFYQNMLQIYEFWKNCILLLFMYKLNTYQQVKISNPYIQQLQQQQRLHGLHLLKITKKHITQFSIRLGLSLLGRVMIFILKFLLIIIFIKNVIDFR